MDIKERAGGSNSVVESQPSKLLVAGSIPVSRSRLCVCLESFDSVGQPLGVVLSYSFGNEVGLYDVGR